MLGIKTYHETRKSLDAHQTRKCEIQQIMHCPQKDARERKHM